MNSPAPVSFDQNKRILSSVTPKKPKKRRRVRVRKKYANPEEKQPDTSPDPELDPIETLRLSSETSSSLSLESISSTNNVSAVMPKVWSEEEVKALVNYLRCRGHSEAWPATKNVQFWSSAATFIANTTHDSTVRTGSACRNKVLNTLRKKFKSPKDAEAYYFPLKLTAAEPVSAEVPITATLLPNLPSLVLGSASNQQLQMISELFKTYCTEHCDISVPDDFLQLALSAMVHLKSCGRSNVLYKLSKALGTMRIDQSDSLFPARRMPMGLVEYCVDFFYSSTPREIHCPSDYRQWLVSMFSLFGTKFVKLYNGPMWRVETTGQDQQALSTSKLTVEARTNVPGLSERTLQRDIAQSGMTLDARIQTRILDSATKASPHATWWIKGDGCDIVPGLCESVQLKWSGDVDLNNGELENAYQVYRSRLDFVSGIGLRDRQEKSTMLGDLKKIHQQLLSDKDFVLKELATANTKYHEKLQSGDNNTKALFTIGWKVEELKQLTTSFQEAIVAVNNAIDMVTGKTIDLIEVNFGNKLCHIREMVTSLISDLSQHQRVPATHIFVMMISNEQRDAKPYAYPVQCIPYHSITCQQMRELVSNLVKEMTSRGMKVAGFCSNGEYNAMRSQGYTRPLSVFKIRSIVRSKYAKMSKERMIKMLSLKSTNDGKIIAEVPNVAINEGTLLEIAQWRDKGIEWSDIVRRLRPRTVPTGYTYCPWRPGKEETEVEMLRSILAQLEFTHTVRDYDENGVPFRTYLHVPEMHPDSGTCFLEREDEGHVLKRIAQCTRNGGPQNLQLQRFAEALHDSEAGLTYPALVGSRKQSVEDAERLFSAGLLQFMEKRGYSYEARYIRVILEWRKACDYRGLSELERCHYNYNFLNFILEELMPWYTHTYDFSLLEVNRDISRICGFTREVLTAVIADIETREWRRATVSQHSLKPEHPRSSTSDDVECFFSVMRDQIGLNFTLKQVQFAWRKICMEFQKRIDIDLPFYYFTSAHDRFYEGPRPSFDVPPSRQKKKRLPRREQIQAASLKSGRATFPVRGTLTTRPKFHKQPVNIPPLSHIPVHTSEHSYAMSK